MQGEDPKGLNRLFLIKNINKTKNTATIIEYSISELNTISEMKLTKIPLANHLQILSDKTE